MTTIEFLRHAAKWLPDLIAMPTRVRLLNEARAGETDRRLHCMSCATGRIGEVKHFTGHIEDAINEGVCDACGAAFLVRLTTSRVLGVKPLQR
jgi:hypothetical protein